MDLSQLPQLGKVAGVPGVGMGAVALVLGGVLAAADLLPEGWRGPVLLVVAVGAVGLGALVVLGWARAARGAAQTARTRGDRSAAENVDESGTGGRQHASTTGASSPARNRRR